MLFSLRVCLYLRSTQPLADPIDVDGGCYCSCFAAARARVKEEIDSRVAPHLGGDAFHQYLSLLFARVAGTVAWVQHVDGQASRNINIRVGHVAREAHEALLREEQALFTMHPTFYSAFKASFDYIDVLLQLASTIAALPVVQRNSALMDWLGTPAAAMPRFLVLPWGSVSSGALLLLRTIPQRCRVISTHSHAPLLLTFEAVRADNGWDSATLPYLAHEVQALHHRLQQKQFVSERRDDVLGLSANDDTLPSCDAADTIQNLALQWCHLPSWQMSAFIFKTGDDLRQEELAMQLLRVCSCSFAAAHGGLWMFVYDIVAVSSRAGSPLFCILWRLIAASRCRRCPTHVPTPFIILLLGFIQVVPGAQSVDSLKKIHGVQTLPQVSASRALFLPPDAPDASGRFMLLASQMSTPRSPRLLRAWLLTAAAA